MNSCCKNMKSSGSDPEINQPHVMPIPPTTPWNSGSMPWTVATMQQGVMQFSAQSDLAHKRAMNFQKRKSEIIPSLPTKQFISEEKITAHFGGMHISTDYLQHNEKDMVDVNNDDLDDNKPSTSGKNLHNQAMTIDYDCKNTTISAKELAEKLTAANRITMCEEIKKLNANSAAFMPNALLNRIEKPCTALVLWQPPPKLQQVFSTAGSGVYNESDLDTEDDEDDGNSGENNNNSSSFDYNNLNAALDGMDTEDL